MDREQVRRDAERWQERVLDYEVDTWEHTVGEQAATILDLLADLQAAEARLAAVPALVEALRQIEHRCVKAGLHGLRPVATDALAAYEQAQGEKQ